MVLKKLIDRFLDAQIDHFHPDNKPDPEPLREHALNQR